MSGWLFCTIMLPAARPAIFVFGQQPPVLAPFAGDQLPLPKEHGLAHQDISPLSGLRLEPQTAAARRVVARLRGVVESSVVTFLLRSPP